MIGCSGVLLFCALACIFRIFRVSSEKRLLVVRYQDPLFKTTESSAIILDVHLIGLYLILQEHHCVPRHLFRVSNALSLQ